MSSSLGTVAEEVEEEEKGFNNQWEMVSLGHPKQKQQANAKGDYHTLSKKEKGIEILVE